MKLNLNAKMKPLSKLTIAFFTTAIFLAGPVMAKADPAAPAPRPVGVVARTTNPTGIYHVGEKITLQIKLRDGATDVVNQVEYTAKLHGAKVVAAGKLELTNHVAKFQTSLNERGSLLFTVSGTTTTGQKFSTFAGATAEYKNIRWPLPLPDDFDAFWDGKIAESKKLPLNPKLEPVVLANEPAIDYGKLTLDNINGSHVSGQLARPKTPGKYPAILLVQYAGVYQLKRENVTGLARDGWLVLNISAHDVPFDLPESEFQKLADTTLKDYTAIGQTNRETSYFLRITERNDAGSNINPHADAYLPVGIEFFPVAGPITFRPSGTAGGVGTSSVAVREKELYQRSTVRQSQTITVWPLTGVTRVGGP